MTSNAIFRPLKLLLAAGVMTLMTSVNANADDSASPKPFNVKGTFQSICGFCHEDYGRHAGKGPQLMNSERSDQFMHNRIKNGKPGRMAAFGSIFTDEQIDQIVVFIRNLKPDQEPQNP